MSGVGMLMRMVQNYSLRMSALALVLLLASPFCFRSEVPVESLLLFGQAPEVF